jgi:hypothetical protein
LVSGGRWRTRAGLGEGGGCAVGTGSSLQREVAAAAAWLPLLGWGGVDHGGW